MSLSIDPSLRDSFLWRTRSSNIDLWDYEFVAKPSRWPSRNWHRTYVEIKGALADVDVGASVHGEIDGIFYQAMRIHNDSHRDSLGRLVVHRIILFADTPNEFEPDTVCALWKHRLCRFWEERSSLDFDSFVRELGRISV